MTDSRKKKNLVVVCFSVHLVIVNVTLNELETYAMISFVYTEKYKFTSENKISQ